MGLAPDVLMSTDALLMRLGCYNTACSGKREEGEGKTTEFRGDSFLLSESEGQRTPNYKP